MEERRPGNYTEDEITLKDLILKMGEFFREIRRYWYIVAIACLPFLAWKLLAYINSDPEYKAQLTFMVNEDEGGGMSGVAGILGQFGFGGASSSKFNLDKILELSKSMRILSSALFESAGLDGVNDSYANHFIEAYDLDEKWARKTPEYKDFRFEHDSIAEMNPMEKKALKSLLGMIVGSEESREDPLLSNTYSEESSIMRLRLISNIEQLSVDFLNLLFDKLSEYYIEKTTEKQKHTLKLVEQKRDSIFGELKTAEYALAEAEESTRNVWDSRAKLNQLRLQRQVQALNIMYAEALKNVEIADFSVKNATPFIQVIDRPFLPLEDQRPSLLREIVIALVIGFLIGGIYIVGRKVFHDAMREEVDVQ